MSEREPTDFEYVEDALGDWVNERTPRRDVMIAFDALARIQAHVEALEGERDELRTEVLRLLDLTADPRRVADLEGALRTIAANEYGPDGDGPDFVTIARAALAGAKPSYRDGEGGVNAEAARPAETRLGSTAPGVGGGPVANPGLAPSPSDPPTTCNCRGPGLGCLREPRHTVPTDQFKPNDEFRKETI